MSSRDAITEQSGSDRLLLTLAKNPWPRASQVIGFTVLAVNQGSAAGMADQAPYNDRGKL